MSGYSETHHKSMVETLAVMDPRWDQVTRIHDWRNYISGEVKAMWDTFTDEQKRALYRQSEELADAEIWE